MKIIFNDATEINVQQVEPYGDYSEGDTVYLMDRTGMNTGESVKLYFAPSALLGQYFSAVE